MAEQITIVGFKQIEREFRLHFADGSWMRWPTLVLLNEYIENGSEKPGDQLIRGLLLCIREADPSFAAIASIQNVTYEHPPVREVP